MRPVTSKGEFSVGGIRNEGNIRSSLVYPKCAFSPEEHRLSPTFDVRQVEEHRGDTVPPAALNESHSVLIVRVRARVEVVVMPVVLLRQAVFEHLDLLLMCA